MQIRENEPYLTFEVANKQFLAPYDVIWKISLLNLPMNQFLRAKGVCKEFYIFVTQLQNQHPSWTQAILHQVGYNQNVTAQLLNRDADCFDNLTLFDEHTRNHTIFFNLTGTMIQCGQLGLNVRDHQAPLYVVDNQHHISVFSYQDGTFMGKFVGHQKPLGQQTVIALDRHTMASGDIEGNIFVWSLSLPELVQRQEPDEDEEEEAHSSGGKCFSFQFFKRSNNSKKSTKHVSSIPSGAEAPKLFGKHESPISAMARIDRTHFMSADHSGVIHCWNTETNTPIRTWDTDTHIRALCYLNAESVLYMTYDFTEQGFKHEFTVWKYDGVTKDLYYTHEYLNSRQVESLPRMLCHLSPGFGLFADPTETKNFIFHRIEPTNKDYYSRVKSEQGGYNYEKSLCGFFTPASFVGIVNKGDLPFNYRVTLFEHLTKYHLPTESMSSLVFK